MLDLWTVNSDQSCEFYIEHVRKLFSEHKYLTFPPPRIGRDRSLPQNALINVWCREFAAFLTPCHPKEIKEGDLKGIKRTMKSGFYKETGYSWMIEEVYCPLTKRTKKDYTSSAGWKKGEAFEFLTWLQAFAATKGCILESKGEFNKLQREQNE